VVNPNEICAICGVNCGNSLCEKCWPVNYGLKRFLSFENGFRAVVAAVLECHEDTKSSLSKVEKALNKMALDKTK
jgi:hypothetical protein